MADGGGGLRWSLRSFATQIILRFCGSMKSRSFFLSLVSLPLLSEHWLNPFVAKIHDLQHLPPIMDLQSAQELTKPTADEDREDLCY